MVYGSCFTVGWHIAPEEQVVTDCLKIWFWYFLGVSERSHVKPQDGWWDSDLPPRYKAGMLSSSLQNSVWELLCIHLIVVGEPSA